VTALTIAPADADAFLAACWGRFQNARLLSLLVHPLRSRAVAEAALAAWIRAHPLPLRPGGPLPRALPGGLAIPPAGTPWPRASSPLPLVDLPAEDVLRLAEALLWGRLNGAPLGAPADAAALVALSGGLVDRGDARRLLGLWAARGGALRCVRDASGALDPPRLSPAAARDFLGRARRGEERAAWWLLVRAGLGPREALDRLRAFAPDGDTLPTGQPFDRRDAVLAVTLPGGHELTRAEADPILEMVLGQRRRRAALEALRALAPGLDLDGARAGLDLLLAELAPRGAREDTWGETARAWLMACADDLLEDRPLHWATLSEALLVADESVATMAIGLNRRGRPVLFYAPSFALSLAHEHLKGVLTHEIYHLLFGHLRPPPPAARAHRSAWRIACEVTVNEYVPYALPGAPLTLERFGLPPGESTRQRFERLSETLPPDPAGGVAGASIPGGDMLTSPLSERPRHHRDNEGPGAPQRDPAAALKSALRAINKQLNDPTRGALSRHAGDLPGGLVELIEREGVHQLDWRLLLRRMSRRLGAREATWRWPNRRQPERLGIVPGYRRRRATPVVLAAVDTSASMTAGELSQIADELAALLRRRARVARVLCDVIIQEEGWLRDTASLESVKGRGGTDLRPPFAKAVLDRYRPELIVYFTDGEGPAPAAPPAGVAVLWVLTGPRPKIPARFGEVVCLRPRHERARVRR